MNKEEKEFKHGYSSKLEKAIADSGLINKIQEHGHIIVGNKQYYERQLVLHAIKKFSDESVSTFQTSLIEKMEELFQSNWPPAKADIINLIKNHK